MVRDLLLAAVIAVGVMGVGSAEAADETPVRIGITHNARSGPIFVDEVRGYFAKNGLAAEIRYFDSDAAITDAVADGQIDIGTADLSAPFLAAAAQHRLKIIASASSDETGFPSTCLLVGNPAYDTGFRKMADIAKKRVAVGPAGIGERYGLEKNLERVKLTAKDVTLVTADSADAELADLTAGSADVAVVPYLAARQFQLEHKQGFTIRLSDLAQRQQGVIFVAAKAIETNRGMIEKFIRAYQRGADEYRLALLERDDGGDVIEGPSYQEFRDLVAAKAGIAPDLLIQTVSYVDRLARLDVTDTGQQLKYWQDQGLVDKKVTQAELLDLSFIPDQIGASAKQN